MEQINGELQAEVANQEDLSSLLRLASIQFLKASNVDRASLWKKWLEEEHVEVNDEVFLVLAQHRGVDLVQNSHQARLLYEKVASAPRTQTRTVLSVEYGVQLNSWFKDTGRCTLYHAIDHGKLAVVKVPSAGNDIRNEQRVWDAIKPDEEVKQFPLVGPLRVINLKHGLSSRPAHSKIKDPTTILPVLVMPCYAMSADEWCDRGVPDELSLKWCKQIRDGLRHLHSKGLAHNDVKPSNIFLDYDLNAYLGDYGAITKLGGKLHEYSDGYFPPDVALVADQKADFALLAVAMMEILGKWRPGVDPALQIPQIREMVETITSLPLRELVAELVGE